MAFNAETGGSRASHTVASSIALAKVAHGVALILARIGVTAKSTLRSLQMARMLSTLSSMSDDQLAQIGIKRSDIPQYAETLMASE